MQLGSQSEILLWIHEHSLSRGASQSAVRRRWLSFCTMWSSHSQISSLSKAILALGKTRSRMEPHMGCRGVDRPEWCDVLPPQKKKSLHESCRMGRRIDADSLICSLGHCECDGHTEHTLSQRCLPADLLAPRESDCSRMRSKFSSDWLQCYIRSSDRFLKYSKYSGQTSYAPTCRQFLSCAQRQVYRGGEKKLSYFTIETGEWPHSFEGLTYALHVPFACGNVSQFSRHFHCTDIQHKLTWKRNTFQ